jgi:hypothetical protein
MLSNERIESSRSDRDTIFGNREKCLLGITALRWRLRVSEIKFGYGFCDIGGSENSGHRFCGALIVVGQATLSCPARGFVIGPPPWAFEFSIRSFVHCRILIGEGREPKASCGL